MDNFRLFALFAVMLLLPSLGYAEPPAQSDSTDFSHWYESFRQLRPDPTRGVVIADVTLERDAATLYLASGQVHLVEAIDGRTVGAVFVGSGEMAGALATFLPSSGLPPHDADEISYRQIYVN